MCRPKEKADSRATMLDVVTADGEEFPVKRKLLRSCISLTHAVRDTEQASVCLESVDTLVFDRHALVLPIDHLSEDAVQSLANAAELNVALKTSATQCGN